MSGKKRSGLTLLEMLLSLTLMAIILTLLMSQFFQSENSHRKISANLSERQQSRLIRNIIVSDLKSLVFLKKFHDAKTKNEILKGAHVTGVYHEDKQNGSKQADFISMHVHKQVMQHPEVEGSDPEIHEVHYLVEESDDPDLPMSLYRIEGFYIDEDLSEEGDGVKRLLTDQLVSLNFMFLRDAKGSWSETWTESGSLPMAIKVEFAFQNQPAEKFQVNVRPALGSGIEWDI